MKTRFFLPLFILLLLLQPVWNTFLNGIGGLDPFLCICGAAALTLNNKDAARLLLLAAFFSLLQDIAWNAFPGFAPLALILFCGLLYGLRHFFNVENLAADAGILLFAFLLHDVFYWFLCFLAGSSASLGYALRNGWMRIPVHTLLTFAILFFAVRRLKTLRRDRYFK